MEGKYTLEPLMFSLAIIQRDYRQKDDAWRHIGFIPNYHLPCKEEEKETLAEKALGLFHEILTVLLEDLAVLQNEPPCLSINLFGEIVNVRLILEVALLWVTSYHKTNIVVEKRVILGVLAVSIDNA